MRSGEVFKDVQSEQVVERERFCPEETGGSLWPHSDPQRQDVPEGSAVTCRLLI